MWQTVGRFLPPQGLWLIMELSAISDPVLGIWHFLWGTGQAGKLVSHLVQGGTICVISSINNSWWCSQFEKSPVLLIQLQPVSHGSLLMWSSTNWWPDISWPTKRFHLEVFMCGVYTRKQYEWSLCKLSGKVYNKSPSFFPITIQDCYHILRPCCVFVWDRGIN